MSKLIFGQAVWTPLWHDFEPGTLPGDAVGTSEDQAGRGTQRTMQKQCKFITLSIMQDTQII